MNRATLVGRLGKEPNVAEHNGKKFVRFSIACSERYKDQKGEWQEKTEWVNIDVIGGRLADVAGTLVKGDLVFVDGKITTNKTEKNGVATYFTKVSVSFGGALEKVHFVDTRGDQSYTRSATPAQRSGPVPASRGPVNSYDPLDDEVPF